MRFEFQTLECSHLGYAALQSIFHSEISNDLKVPHINLKQFISAKPSELLTYPVKEKHDKSDAGIIVIVLWWELDFWEAGIFFCINQPSSSSPKMKLQMLSREIGPNSMHSFYAVQGWFGVTLVVYVE